MLTRAMVVVSCSVALCVLTASVGQSSAQVIESGNDIREACQILAGGQVPKDALENAKGGYCLGFVTALLFIGGRLDDPDRFCPPNGVTVKQGNLVFLKYLHDNPDMTHQPAESLAIAAFRKAWRCQQGRRRPRSGARHCRRARQGARYSGALPAEMKGDRMNEVSMSTSEIIEHMKKGAKLHRGFADKIELRLPGGVVFIPQAIFDSLIDQGQIVPEDDGFYRVA
jgi:hypothetical protein